MLRYLRRRLVLFILALITWFGVRKAPGSQSSEQATFPIQRTWQPETLADTSTNRQIGISIITICDIDILLSIERTLMMPNVSEVVLCCEEDRVPSFQALQANLSPSIRSTIYISTLMKNVPVEIALLHAASGIQNEYALILDPRSGHRTPSPEWTSEILSRNLDVGPHIAPTNCQSSMSFEELRPPLVIEKRVVAKVLTGLSVGLPVWSAFSQRLRDIQRLRDRSVDISNKPPLCNPPAKTTTRKSRDGEPGLFISILPDLKTLEEFQSTLCRIALSGHSLFVLISTSNSAQRDGLLIGDSCYLVYFALGTSQDTMQQFKRFISDMAPSLVVIFHVEEPGMLSQVTRTFEQRRASQEVVTVALTREELRHSDWMGTIKLTEWKAWDRMRVEFSVITNNRPRSLSRLLGSLNEALYFGHSNIHLTINMEMTADSETRHIVQDFRWKHGIIAVRHRVVLGGIIPAIVESWYPASNDSYGLLLEDDVELSPLFFAWIKMNILRYRYGQIRRNGHLIYGLSLYSPRNVELRPEGRRPWSARKLLADSSNFDSQTPYLSAVPCSWGAVYFPEHWREFHDFLVTRLAERALPLTEEIVPKVRSNRWKNSWKSFFIELVWLRGYVMVYPNYDNFTSFSTNHLEIGSHVSDASAKAKRKALFVVPLMSLLSSSSLLLELPPQQLPEFEDLPVFDLYGELSALEILIHQADKKRAELCKLPERHISQIGEWTCNMEHYLDDQRQ
ncbi:hypothetical protein CPB86DRAFT_780929 [Serendipita vermifera]|nr:hypothetical protein CPB86DRAFT_780929 [Serendipita vermifera]